MRNKFHSLFVLCVGTLFSLSFAGNGSESSLDLNGLAHVLQESLRAKQRIESQETPIPAIPGRDPKPYRQEVEALAQEGETLAGNQREAVSSVSTRC